MPSTLTPPPAEATWVAGQPKAVHHRLPDGVYVPTLCFFTEHDEVDLNVLERHLVRLINAGVAGIVVHGSNGEVAHLTREERAAVIRCAADTIHQEGHDVRIPLIAGCGAQSTRETLQLCRDAAKSGASHALMLPPSYYGGLLDDDKIVDYFHDVADQSPLPLLIYNFPGAAAGRDLSSDVILRIAAHPNVVGVKLTCGNTGKLARVAADAPEGTGRLLEARRLQAMAAKCDWVAIRTGFVGVKAAIGHFEGYGGEPRRPCVAPTPQELKGIVEGMAELRREEAALESEA
ncbi:Metal-binding regulatory protein cuf1 [Verticillium dahliae VDG1]|nr:Metal-binding regulatory protein cuf1 [Verticillium dahliae VDG1]